MTTDASRDQARRSLRYAISRLRSQAGQLKTSDFPGDHPGPKKWINLISGILDTCEMYLARSDSSGLNPSQELDYIQDAAALVHNAYEYLNFLDGATTEHLPFSIVQPMNRWFQRVNVKNDVFFRAELLANYELAPFSEEAFASIREKSDTLDIAISAINWPLYRVTLPSQAFSILPHFSIVAHEIGHALVGRMDNQEIEAPLNALAQTVLRNMSERSKIWESDPTLKKALTTVFKNWFSEYASDSIGFHITGPALFFAFSDFMNVVGVTGGVSISHPPPLTRRDALFEKTTTGEHSYAQVFEKHTGVSLKEDINSPLLQQNPSPDDIYAHFVDAGHCRQLAAAVAEWSVQTDALIDLVDQTVNNFLYNEMGAVLYTVERYDQDLRNHYKSLMSAIPPIETGTNLYDRHPVEFESVLNVGWAVLLTGLRDMSVQPDTTSDSTTTNAETLNSLLLKAIELSEARRTWEGE